MKDPDNKKKWIIDEEAAAVVQQIFALCVSGMGPTQIAKWLEKSEILNPTFYWLSKGMKVATSRSRGQTRTSGRMKRFPVCLKR